MAGYGSSPHLQQLAKSSDSDFSIYMNGNHTQFLSRSDVRMIFNEKRGVVADLEIGFGIENQTRFGPEVGFGWTVGHYFEEPVLIIKVAWGSTSLAEHWRSPSAAKANGTSQWNQTGNMWEWMLDMKNEVNANPVTKYFPNYVVEEGEAEDWVAVAGVAWLQGWSDLLDEEQRAEYESNLNYFVGDVLDEFGSNTPFLIGELGQGGETFHSDIKEEILEMRQIQKRVSDSFGANVEFVPTHSFVVENGEHFNGLHHYYGRADTVIRIGKAFGKAMIAQATTSSPSQSASPTTSSSPSRVPSRMPMASFPPSERPSATPSSAPSTNPSQSPSLATRVTTDIPTSTSPSALPTGTPSWEPSNASSEAPSSIPSQRPSNMPTNIVSIDPTSDSSTVPSTFFSSIPSDLPSRVLSASPSDRPSMRKSPSPSFIPSTETIARTGRPSTRNVGDNLNSISFPSIILHLEQATKMNCSAHQCGLHGDEKWTVCYVDPHTKMTVTSCVPKSSQLLDVIEEHYCGPCIAECAEKTNANDSCDDSSFCSFRVYGNPTQMERCTWLKGKGFEILAQNCAIGQPARELCPETCGACVDQCEDDETFAFDLFGVNWKCSTLYQYPHFRDTVCRPDHGAWDSCKEYCGNCAAA